LDDEIIADSKVKSAKLRCCSLHTSTKNGASACTTSKSFALGQTKFYVDIPKVVQPVAIHGLVIFSLDHMDEEFAYSFPLPAPLNTVVRWNSTVKTSFDLLSNELPLMITQLSKLICNTRYPDDPDDILLIFEDAQKLAFDSIHIPQYIRVSAVELLRIICIHRQFHFVKGDGEKKLISAFENALKVATSYRTSRTALHLQGHEHSSHFLVPNPLEPVSEGLICFIRTVAEKLESRRVRELIRNALDPSEIILAHRARYPPYAMRQLVVLLESIARHDVLYASGNRCVVTKDDGFEHDGQIIGHSKHDFDIVLDGNIEHIKYQQVKWYRGDTSSGQVLPVYILPQKLQIEVTHTCQTLLQCLPERNLPLDMSQGDSLILWSQLRCLALLALRSQLETGNFDTSDSIAERRETASCILNWLKVNSNNCMKYAPFSKIIESRHPYQSNHTTHIPLYFPAASQISVEIDRQSDFDSLNTEFQVVQHDATTHAPTINHKIQYRGENDWGNNNYLVCPGNYIVIHFHSSSNLDKRWGWRLRVVPKYDKCINKHHTIAKKQSQLSILPELTISPVFTSIPLQPFPALRSWKCTFATRAQCQKKKSSVTKDPRWVTMPKQAFSFCQACAIFMSTKKRVVTFSKPLQPSYKTSKSWYCDHISPYCERVDGTKSGSSLKDYTGTRWTAIWEDNTYDLCDACVNFFSIDSMQIYSSEVSRYISIDNLRNSTECTRLYEFTKKFLSPRVKELSLYPIRALHTPKNDLYTISGNIVSGEGIFAATIPDFKAQPTWVFEAEILAAGTEVAVGWINIDTTFHVAKKLFMLPLWVDCTKQVVDDSKKNRS
jgi:hypothetical protein